MSAPLYRRVGDALEPLALHEVVRVCVAGSPPGYSVSVAGALSRLAEGRLTVDDLAASGLLRAAPDPDPAPWGAVLTVGQDPQGRPWVVRVPNPAPNPEPDPAPDPEPEPVPLAMARAAALDALAAAREGRLNQGWWCLQDLGQGPAWYLYQSLPSETRALLAGAVMVARRRLAAGAADAFPYRCQSQADLAGGWPSVQRLHTAAQLEDAMDAGAALLADAGRIYDVGRAAMEAAADAGELASALAAAAAGLAAGGVPPEGGV